MSQINLNDAIDLTSNWRSFNSTNTINGSNIDQYLPNAFTIPLADIQAILAQNNVDGIRVYLGYNSSTPLPGGAGNFPTQLVAVGVDTYGDDLLANEAIYDTFDKCPPLCSSNSPLT